MSTILAAALLASCANAINTGPFGNGGGQGGTAQGIDVYYREAGQHYHLRTGFVLKVITARQCS